MASQVSGAERRRGGVAKSYTTSQFIPSAKGLFFYLEDLRCKPTGQKMPSARIGARNRTTADNSYRMGRLALHLGTSSVFDSAGNESEMG